jgi:hypothetical protein
MLLFTLILGCSPSDDPVPGIERDVLWAMPNDSLLDANGHLDLPADRLPHPIAGSAIPVERLTWRTGFSPVQTTVFFPTEWLDSDSLPTPADSEEAGSVQIWDLDAGARIPAFAEIDLFPQDEEIPTLLVRPLVPMTVGHRVAVVVTEEVKTESGESISAPDWVAEALDGQEVEGMSAATYRDDAATLAGLGVEDIAFFSAFPVADGSAQLRSMVEAVTVPQGWTFDEPQTSEETDLIPPGIWTRVEGTFEINDFLVDDAQFELDGQGMPIEQDTGEVELFVYISDGAAAAEPGTAPVWIFGHGVFSEPDFYLFKEEDVSGVADIADRAGAILLGTIWRGMTYTDVLTAVNVGNDFGRIPELSDKLAQGVANNVALSRLILEGDLLEDPVFGGVADPSQVFYYGISLGGIQGAVMMANNPYIDHAVLHVGGSTWSTLLERSSHWPTFEILVESGIPSPAERQVLYSLSQLFWDVSDPACFASELSERSVLWQEAIGDEQVPNLTTEILARGVGAPLMSPSATTPPLLDSVEAPTTGPVLVQFDSELGVPPEGNRPAVVTGAHDAPRLWEGQHAQVLRFLDPVDPGVVEHFCGDAVCSASNTGE